ncbi:hypothetical protein [Kineococcus glutinatus]|uniref:NADPH-dependent FMN reductase n=1 Tax=Kineococcus glutinatus TaxID=1070872 RepID=A0ABP9HNJ5_9ACTN
MHASLALSGEPPEVQVLALHRLSADLAQLRVREPATLELREALAEARTADALVVAAASGATAVVEEFLDALAALPGLPVVLALVSPPAPPSALDVVQFLRARLLDLGARPVRTTVVADRDDRRGPGGSLELLAQIAHAADELARAVAGERPRRPRT